MSILSDEERYIAAAHAVQSGIKYAKDKSFMEPKHLRVGIDTAKVEQGGLATLLIEKGIITKEEYMKAIADAREAEKVKWENKISEEYNAEIKL